ncbi:MAG: aminoglycoside phosphotransferase family protein [Anaerolineae bacterium]|nr:aminoglycoside phosphotransferase family protein [Anaerolineae bacterium]
MPPGKMHADEVDTDASLVRRLLAPQFPAWADLPIAPVPSAGTDNALYRLGDNMVVRLPRIHWAVHLVDKEYHWLPKLAPRLPLAIPVPLAKGMPADDFPWPWAVYRWLDGEDRTPEGDATRHQIAVDMAAFILALQRIDPPSQPSPGPLDSDRGVPLAVRDPATRIAIAALRGMLDTDALTSAWEAALDAPVWHGPPVWLHGDLRPGNFLYQQGRLSAVIDFGCLGVGDPACDLQVAWNLLAGDARDAFRAALQVDDATWARGRGWALSVGVIALPYYQTTNPDLAAIARRAIEAVLTDS